MGMYTELFINCRLKPNLPENVDNILDYLFNKGGVENKPTELPEHEFFKACRWDHVGCVSSFSHIPFPLSCYKTIYDTGYITSRSDFKNYEDEIKLFVDWITPYIETNEEGKTCIGWCRYEEDQLPTLIILEGNVTIFLELK